MADIVSTLARRGLISQQSDPDLQAILAAPTTVYAGFDPTSSSLHVGNLLQIMLLAQFQRHGHRPIALLGGATAMIGDPSGKSAERNLLDEATIAANLAGIRRQLEHYIDFSDGRAVLVNNADWIGRFSFVEFLRDVGKHFRVGEMLGKESVRRRINSEAGLSFTEFSYQLLQAYDFLHLFREYGCTVQTGGDDQWGNITAGIELTRRLEGKSVYGITSPLLTTAGGAKFGKTEQGAIWLDADRTSPYEFYQYWIRSDDRDVIKLLNYFTFLPDEEITELKRCVEAEPEKRQAQKVLAEHVTRMTHGDEGVRIARQASGVLFGQEITGLSDADLTGIFADVPSTGIPRDRLNGGIELLDVLCESRLCSSRGDAKKLIKAGGAYINNIRIDAIDHKLTPKSLASETICVLRSGKKNYHLLRFT
ncbi:MAG: tyrosine--tRNA ligase [Sedimentisphaerales bacterium]|nr:tyrosine--tRNA ligase [Sedimentisphaerales bacterium]